MLLLPFLSEYYFTDAVGRQKKKNFVKWFLEETISK
jgi:hypothetical protein